VPLPRVTQVYVADDQPLFLRAVVEALEAQPGLEVVGWTVDGRQAAAAIIELEPDVAVLDVRLRGWSGQEVLDLAVERGISTRFLFLSDQLDSDVVFDALGHGAASYISKEADSEAICSAVVAVANGETVLSTDVQKSLASAIRNRTGGPHAMLTPRERAVLSLAAEGLSTREIAKRLGVSSATVKAHLQGSYIKLDVPDRTSAVASALRRGLLD
jgi:two-component system nitrate/nitrite response regulator NarL